MVDPIMYKSRLDTWIIGSYSVAMSEITHGTDEAPELIVQARHQNAV